MDGEAIQDLFQDLGAVRVRRMFGGQGIYLHGQIFAIVAGGEIYLKVDAGNLSHFQRARSRPFTYERDGRAISMSYWLMPSEALDDPAEAARWARLSVDAAERAAASRSIKGRRTA
jgi:DNA transformation protein